MWTPTTRREYSREGLRYGSDLTDAEWAIIAPFLPPPAPCKARRPARGSLPWTTGTSRNRPVDQFYSATMAHYPAAVDIYRDAMWIPALFERSDLTVWRNAGGREIRDKIRDRLATLLGELAPDAL